MTTVSRFDKSSPITRTEKTPEGYLKVWSRTARTGVQVYHKADGSVVREYRPPEEVASPEALASFQMKVVTWNHPPVLLTAENTKDYQIGHNGSEAYFVDGFVEVPHIITDAESIRKIENKEAVEVSPGYKVEADPTPGISPEGERYDVVQRNIRINHVAVVQKGRSGPEVRLLLDRMDSSAAVAWDQDTDPVVPPPPKISMATVNLDGLTLDLPTEVAGPVQNYVQNTNTKLSALTDRIDTLESDNEDLQNSLDLANSAKETAEGRADALELALSEADGDGTRTDSDEDAEGRFYVTPAELDELLVKRLQTLQHLAPVMEEDFNFDSIDDDSLYITAYENIFGEAPDDEMSMDYLRGSVDAYIHSQTKTDAADAPRGRTASQSRSRADAAEASREDSTSTLRGQLAARKPNPGSERADAARQARLDRWKQPMTTSKPA
jgi:hypothetical protein